MTQLRDRRADTTIHFNDGSTRSVPQGDVIRLQEGWVSVTTKMQRPDHPLSAPGHGTVELTDTWHSSQIKRIETIREVWT